MQLQLNAAELYLNNIFRVYINETTRYNNLSMRPHYYFNEREKKTSDFKEAHGLSERT